MIYPGIAIVIVVVVFNMLGDGIRDILDPETGIGKKLEREQRYARKEEEINV